MLVEQSSGPLDAFSKLASVRPGRRPAAHRRAQGGSFRSEAFLFARGLGEGKPPSGRGRRGKGVGFQRAGATGEDEPASGGARQRKRARFPAFRASLQASRLGKPGFRARTARSGPKRPEPRSGKPGIVPKRRLKPFRGSESPGTRQRSSQDGPSRTAPIRQRPKGAPPTSRERGRFEFGVALRAPFCGPSSRSALRIGRQGPGGEVEPPASGTKGLSLCPTSAAP